MKSEYIKIVIFLLRSLEKLGRYNKIYVIYVRYRSTYFKKKKPK